MTQNDINGNLHYILMVADTGNHRIRKIDYSIEANTCFVTCFSGLCGNNTLSFSVTTFAAAPISGYADGAGLEARFSAPQDVLFFDNQWVIVADTGNFLLRIIKLDQNHTTYTLAGTVIPGETDPHGLPLAGCTPPCMQGSPGYRDGYLNYTQFYQPISLSLGPNNTVWIVDEHRVRVLEMPHTISTMYGIDSEARVSTIAGTSLTGHDDGLAQWSTFYYTAGIYVTPRGIAYVTDAASCHVRRITPYPIVAQPATCGSIVSDFLRPSGCVSYDMPLDKIGRKVSRVEGNIQYNYEPTPHVFPTMGPGALHPTPTPTRNPSVTAVPTVNDVFLYDKNRGKYIKNCVGSPPPDRFTKHFITQGDNLVIDDHRVSIDEDSEKGMAMLIHCPGTCSKPVNYTVQGNAWYSEYSSICLAAVHDGKLHVNESGYLLVIIERYDYLQEYQLSFAVNGVTRFGVTSGNINPATPRVFRMERYNQSDNFVHTIAGSPNAPLETACGNANGQPATDARFNYPGGIVARPGVANISDFEYLYIADTNNHMIRALSAICTFICENGGRCIGDDLCSCPPGWTGIDCTKPMCNTPCGPNSVCVGPDTCGCKPGFSGPHCNIPLCQQRCLNGGNCSAPDTCSCPAGYFDANCSTPVCSITCGNGGNCTAPNMCACPTEWTGPDCRIPVCNQTCHNHGFCVAPNTCQCPPQWSNYDCSAPVCSQGFFEAFPGNGEPGGYFTVKQVTKPVYKNCDIQSWCNATNEFECDQPSILYNELEILSGPKYRHQTGRSSPPKECTEIELPIDFKIPFTLVRSDNTTTGNMRFSPNTQYTSNSNNPWRGYLNPTEAHTGPWIYSNDRQIAQVNWFNFSQGRYVCANGGFCVTPDVCSCAPGWMGFDCRTPICHQGYYNPNTTAYVSGQGTPTQFQVFKSFMNKKTDIHNGTWPYANPAYTIQVEFYNPGNHTYVNRQVVHFPARQRYLANVQYDKKGNYNFTYQGGYRCSIRAWTKWEHEGYVFDHPNFFSQYMDRHLQEDNVTYTFWQNMLWPDVHRKSRVLDYTHHALFNRTYAYTNQGWRRRGIWNRTVNNWEYGICILEFYRNCSNPRLQFDLQSGLFGLTTLDPDLSYRPRITFSDFRVDTHGRWKQANGQCVDHVIRGCVNNGTCIAPGKCQCGPGWTGPDCMDPICNPKCQHHGNCTSPGICTCERGWSGFDCTVPLCAQECQNGGQCVAPDTCKCFQFDNNFYDGRIAGGHPLFQNPDTTPQKTGWTGYDCSTPICVQAEKWVPNVASKGVAGYVTYGGHGADGLLTCQDPTTHLQLPRCNQYNYELTYNDGTSWQTGCGYDPWDTGCCVIGAGNYADCYKCPKGKSYVDANQFFCIESFDTSASGSLSGGTNLQKNAGLTDDNNNLLLCGAYLQPRQYTYDTSTGLPTNYGKQKFYTDALNAEQTNFNFRSNLTSNRFLCHLTEWEEGDYIDNAGVLDVQGKPVAFGRHTRLNYPNIHKDAQLQQFTYGGQILGEGIYACFNGGSCLAPDICTCEDGYTGFDCSTPLCRHLQPLGSVTSCLNGGICSRKDNCDCIQTPSLLWKVHPGAPRAPTGWTGSDCSMPMCSQGYYDPFCTDLPQAPGGEGCYRCSNGGNCTAPDVCTCAAGWTGFDCKTPVCETVADPLTRTQLDTYYEDKVIGFESDPCGMRPIYGMHGFHGTKYAHGNCTQPNQCTCLCKIPYNAKACKKAGERWCFGPWQDNLVLVRNLLTTRGPQFTFGSTDCAFGYEGNVNELDQFVTCHQTIYYPSQRDRNSEMLTIVLCVFGIFLFAFYWVSAGRLKRKFLLAKIERRKTKRSSEDSMSHDRGSSSFVAGGSSSFARSTKVSSN